MAAGLTWKFAVFDVAVVYKQPVFGEGCLDRAAVFAGWRLEHFEYALFVEAGQQIVDVVMVAGDAAEALVLFDMACEAADEVVAEIDARGAFDRADMDRADDKARR